MAARASGKIPPLHNTRKTPSLCYTRYIHKLACLEYCFACYLLTCLIAVWCLAFKFFQMIKTWGLCLSKVAAERLIYPFFLFFKKAKLDGIVTIFGLILLLDHKTRPCLYHCDRNYLSLFGKYLRHTNLFSQHPV